MPKISSVDEFFESVGPVKAATFRALIDHVLSLDERLTVTIAWNVPQVKLGTQYVFGMSANKNHLSMAPWGNVALETMRPTMTNYELTDKTFRVPVDWAIDKPLITEMVRLRLNELEPL